MDAVTRDIGHHAITRANHMRMIQQKIKKAGIDAFSDVRTRISVDGLAPVI